MSNPLAVFRKYERILLAVFGVLLMVVFTVGGIVGQYSQRSATGGENDVVVKLDSGDIRETDLQNLKYARIQARRFMQGVNMLAAENGATPRQTLGIPDTDDEASLVETAILARKAEELGIQVSDEAVLQFLLSYSQGTLEKGDLARILYTVTQGRMTQNQLFSTLRRELLALRYTGLLQRGMLTPTPAAAWDYYQRLNRRVTFEAVPFPAEDYLARVEDPSEAELKALYEEGKNRYPRPDVPEPGFKEPKKIAVQYVKASLDDFITEAKASITDEQVAAYYEDNKEQYRNIQLPSFDTDSPFTPAEGSSDVQVPADADLDADASTLDLDTSTLETPSDSGPDTPDGATDAAPELDFPELDTPDAVAPTDTDASPQPLQDDPNEEGPKVNSAPEQVPDEESAEAADDAASTETAEGESEPSASNDATAEQSSQEPGPAESNEETETGDDAPANDAETAEDPTPGAESADAETADSEAIDTSGENDDPLGNLPEAAGNNDASQQPTYKPLEEVAEEIRTTLATPIARDAMDQAINEMRSLMKSHFSDYIAWELAPNRDEKSEPTPPDLRGKAAELGVTVGNIPLVNVLELQETDPITNEPLYVISRAFDMNGVSFAQQAYDDNLRKYEIRGIRGQALDTEYLYWKTDERAEKVPTFEEARDTVARALKMKAALPLAEAAAKEAVEALRKSGQRPSDAYRNDPNRRVIQADSVSWMTSFGIPQIPPRVTQIPGIRYPGDGFMSSVFSLNAGEATVALDNPKKVCYAVSVISVDTETDQLRTAFLRSGPTNDTLVLARMDNQRRLRDWYTKVEEELGIKWNRDPLPDSRTR